MVISTTTDTGYARAVQLYGRDRVFRYPLDFGWAVGRVLKRVRPDLIVLVELEVWPNLVGMATTRGVPVVVVNGRLTERSARRFGRIGPIARSMFKRLTWVGAQDQAIAERFESLGTPAKRIEVTSSMKWDTAVVNGRVVNEDLSRAASEDVQGGVNKGVADERAVNGGVDGADELALALRLDGSQPLWVCGSTGPGEEAMLLEAYRGLVGTSDGVRRGEGEKVGKCEGEGVGAGKGGTVNTGEGEKEKRCEGEKGPTPILALVPRKPERFDEVARLIEREGFRCIRRSERPDGTSSNGDKAEVPVERPDDTSSHPSKTAGSVEQAGQANHDSAGVAMDDQAGGQAPNHPVILGDTMGELRKFYSLADVVFVGRSLVPMGGSDPMEVAALGKAMVVGPHTDNFKMPVEALRVADALRIVESPAELVAAVRTLLDDPASASSLGDRARQVVVAHQGATKRTVEALVRVIEQVSS